jgi:hypothetical protein
MNWAADDAVTDQMSMFCVFNKIIEMNLPNGGIFVSLVACS